MTASVTFQEPPKDLGARHVPGTGQARASVVPGTNVAPGAPVILVPKRAVAEQGGQSFVWVVTGGTVARRPVTLGAERIDQVELRSGVVPGEVVIMNPPQGLADGGTVRVKGS